MQTAEQTAKHVIQPPSKGEAAIWKPIHTLYMMLLPYIIGTVLLVLFPLIFSITMSFSDYNIFDQPRWNGLDNYSYLPSYLSFRYAITNTLLFIVMAVPLRLLVMIGMAMLLERDQFGVRIMRTMVYLPMLFPDIAYALLWSWIFNPVAGLVGIIATSLNQDAPLYLLEDDNRIWLLLIMSLFQIGEGFVVLLAGLKAIPLAYYEASSLDGGNRWQIFRWITLPLLAPWIVLLTLRDIVFGAPSVFTPAFVMMGSRVDDLTWFLPQMIYEETFSRFRYGVASSVMVVWMIVAGVLLGVAYRILRGWGYADET